MALLDILSHPPVLILFTLSLATLLYLRLNRSTSFPTINAYANDFFYTKARAAYATNALDLLRSGLTRFPESPFRIITALGDRIILPHAWISFVRTHKDFDHQDQVAAEFFGDYPGFEAIGAFNDPSKVLIDVIKQRMSSMTPAMIEAFETEINVVLGEVEISSGDEWTSIDWPRLCNRFVALTSSSLFVGPRLGRDEEWLALIQSYTVNLFNAARVLRSWPPFTRPVIHWMLPECRLLRAQMSEARARLAAFEAESKTQDGQENTVLSWLKDTGSKKGIDMAAIQLGLAAGGLHTTSQLLQQVLLDIAVQYTAHPALISDLRRELRDTLALSGGQLVVSSLPKLNLLDACVKESQRLKPQVMVNLERMATRDIVLPSGDVVRAGTQIAIGTVGMFEGAGEIDGDVAGETKSGREKRRKGKEEWDAYRWIIDSSLPPPGSDIKSENEPGSTATLPFQSTNTQAKLVNSSNGHFAFGMGKFICPGRFLVAAEVKIVLLRMLEQFDVRIKAGEESKIEGGRVKWRGYGFEMLTEWEIGVEMKRRRGV